MTVFSCWFTQLRLVPTDGPTEMRSYGPCREFEAWICYLFYQIEQESGLASGLTIYATFFLKYKMVSSVRMSNFSFIMTYVIFYIPLLVSLGAVTIILLTQTFPYAIQQQFHLLNSQLTQDYSVIAYLSLAKLPNLLNLVILTGCIIVIPIMSLYLRKKILTTIDTRIKNMSVPRQVLYKNFLRGLTIQSILPYIIYFPIYSLDYYCTFTGQTVLLDEYLITLIPALPSLVDPIISLYFVTPYRRKIIQWVKRERDGESLTTVAVTN